MQNQQLNLNILHVEHRYRNSYENDYYGSPKPSSPLWLCHKYPKKNPLHKNDWESLTSGERGSTCAVESQSPT
jgi:hypothetical protein